MHDEFLPPERIGFIGLGNMGAPMALHLATAGFQVLPADASPSALARFCGTAHCVPAESLRQLSESCRVVITMLPDGATVHEVLLGDNGVAAGLARGAVVIDMSSAEPAGTRARARRLAESGIALIDAPVSGGVQRARAGTLAIMAGGDAPAIARCQKILAALGQTFRCGASGSGHAVKALNNFLSAVALAATAEAMLAAEKFGLDPAVALEVINHSTGRNTATDQKYPAFVLSGTFDSGFALGLMAKDLRIALGLAEALGTPAALLSECSGLWNAAQQRLGFAADNTEIVKYLRQHPGSRGS